MVRVQCGKCGVQRDKKACRIQEGTGPDFCPTVTMGDVMERARKIYQDPEVLEFARQSSIQEAQCYADRDREPYVRRPVKPRIQETCEFARKMGYKKLGLAYCGGLQSEAVQLTKIFEQQGFEVISVVCKVGCTPKEEIGLEDAQKVRPGHHESMCSPIAQAEVLNEAGTEFNIVLGLCVGHDSHFLKYAKSMSTVIAVKDRVLGHNPLAALYTLHSYYQRLLQEDD